MGFISFNETYYRKKLEIFENKKLTEKDVYEIQQLLKVLDDLTDEGYTNLNDHMEANFSCLSRLRALLNREGAVSFPLIHKVQKSTTYGIKELELSELLDTLMAESKEKDRTTNNSFIKEIYNYCQWIEYAEDTAYVFLLRDTLLPYAYFKEKYGEHIYPWLVSRKFLEDITKIEYVDDDIRLPIYEALEKEYTSFEDCCRFCKKEILDVLNQHPKLKQILLNLLESLEERRVVIIESGYMGTIPMMLKALDERVTFRLYTTAPFLYETYKDSIYCRRYEDIRKFETICSQDLLMRYSSFHNGKFYVNLSEDADVMEQSLAEIESMIR